MTNEQVSGLQREIEILERKIATSRLPEFLLIMKKRELGQKKGELANLEELLSKHSNNEEELRKLVQRVASGELAITESETSVILKKNERVVCAFSSITLLEERIIKLKGMSHGFSLRIMKGLWYRPTYHTGGAEIKVAPVDEGDFVLTNKRIVFTGEKKSKAFTLSSIIAIDQFTEGISINRTRKQKIEYFSGFDTHSVNNGGTNLNGGFIKAVISDIIQNTE